MRLREIDEAYFFLAAAGFKPPLWYRLVGPIRRLIWRVLNGF